MRAHALESKTWHVFAPAQTHSTDLVVLGTHGRQGLDRLLLLGYEAEALMRGSWRGESGVMNEQGKGKLLPTGKLGLARDVSYDIIHEDSERKIDSGGTVKWKKAIVHCITCDDGRPIALAISTSWLATK